MPIVIAALFIIAKTKNTGTTQMSSNDKWTNKMWSTNTMEYDSKVKRNKILVNAAPWINLKNIMLHVRSQWEKSTCCMIPFIGVLRRSKPVETKSRLVMPGAGDWKRD